MVRHIFISNDYDSVLYVKLVVHVGRQVIVRVSDRPSPDGMRHILPHSVLDWQLNEEAISTLAVNPMVIFTHDFCHPRKQPHRFFFGDDCRDLTNANVRVVHG